MDFGALGFWDLTYGVSFILSCCFVCCLNEDLAYFVILSLNSPSKESDYSFFTLSCFSIFFSYPIYLLLFSFAIWKTFSAISLACCTEMLSFSMILQRSTLIVAAIGDLEMIFLSLSLKAKRYRFYPLSSRIFITFRRAKEKRRSLRALILQ